MASLTPAQLIELRDNVFLYLRRAFYNYINDPDPHAVGRYNLTLDEILQCAIHLKIIASELKYLKL